MCRLNLGRSNQSLILLRSKRDFIDRKRTFDGFYLNKLLLKWWSDRLLVSYICVADGSRAEKTQNEELCAIITLTSVMSPVLVFQRALWTKLIKEQYHLHFQEKLKNSANFIRSFDLELESEVPKSWQSRPTIWVKWFDPRSSRIVWSFWQAVDSTELSNELIHPCGYAGYI